jgi:competence protein ComEA
MREGSRVYEALASAGGLAEDADIKNINRAAPLKDGDRIYVPTAEETAEGAPLPASAGSGAGPGLSASSGADPGAAAPGAVNINTADSSELQKLNGVGPSTAQKIIDYRNGNGAFGSPEELMNVSGIGRKTFEKMKDAVTVD